VRIQTKTSDQVDQEFVSRVQRGDKSAYDMLVRKYQHRVTQLVNRYVKDPSEAQDVAQEAFIKAYRALVRFRGDSAFYTWLYRIAINTAKNHLVARARRSFNNEVDFQEAEYSVSSLQLCNLDTPEKLLLNDEIIENIQQTIDELPENMREVIILRELEGLSYEAIAKTLDCPVGTVRSRIFRAREAIDKRLQPLLEG
jgi:RNA polymerase sigma-70 factor, ECF subfamily